MEKWVKRERQRQGVSIYALAKKSGVPASTIMALEKGGKRLKTINKLIDALGYKLVIEKRMPF
jgi:transcriptional regulator with XRE-family HTH domain